jgi:hypothetical protein
MLSAAVREPVAPGVKVTLTVQVPVEANVELHVLVCEKSAALVPVKEMPEIVTLLEVSFVTVKFCAEKVEPTPRLQKFRLDGEIATV